MLTTRRLAHAYCCCLLALRPSETLFATLPFIFHASPFYISKLPRSLSVALPFSLAPSPPTTIFSPPTSFLLELKYISTGEAVTLILSPPWSHCALVLKHSVLCMLLLLLGNRKCCLQKKILSTLIAHKLLLSRSIHLICKTVIKKVLHAPPC